MTSTRERFGGSGTAGSGTAVGGADGGAVGKRTLTEQAPVQRKLAGSTGSDGNALAGSVEEAAAHGTSGSGGSLPHGEAIQRSFGRHDVSGIVAHSDGAAAEGAQAMGAQAFASGGRVAFAGSPDLHTAAHEAAHVVQQRGGVQLKGGVGAEGDPHEQHADAVADKVVAGGSAESLLDQYAGSGGGGGGSGGVQMKIGLSQATGTKVRQVSTGSTGVIAGNMVWSKYPVKWDTDGKTTQVDPNDSDFEVVGGAPTTTPTTPPTTTPTTTPTTAPTTAPTTTPTTTPSTTPSTTATSGGKQPDRGLSEFDDAEFQRQWLAKQDEVYLAVQAFVPSFLALDPSAEVRVRGSIATGVKANPAKVHPTTGERLLFNPTDFDIDAYVASDVLYNQALKASGTADAAARGKIPGSKLPAVNKIIRQMRIALATIAGNRDAPEALRYRFNVIIRSFRNDTSTINQDEKGMGGPMMVEPENN